VRLAYAVESTPLDTAGAIRFAATEVGVDDTFVVVNGDVLTDLDVGALVARHRAAGGEGTIHLTPVEDPSAFGVVPTDDEGRVLAFIEKPAREEAPTNLINAGTYVLEPSVLARIPADRPVSIERETFPALVAEGKLFALATDDYWLDAGRPAEYLRANLDLVDRRADLAPVAPSAVIGTDAKIDRSVIGAGARIGEGACIRGSVLLPGAEVGPGARLEDTVLGHGASVGRDSELVGCVLGDGARTDDGARLHDAKVPNPD